MKKNLKVDFYCESRKWPRRLPKLKSITLKTLKNMKSFFSKKYFFNLNLILSDQEKVSKLNKIFRNQYKDTDVLTFVSKISNKELGKLVFCDIFFSIDTIEHFIKKNKVTIYDHYNHLLVHSFLHINGYDHKNVNQFKKMKNKEIYILNKLNVKNPYIN